jgi:hypothetical protein
MNEFCPTHSERSGVRVLEHRCRKEEKTDLGELWLEQPTVRGGQTSSSDNAGIRHLFTREALCCYITGVSDPRHAALPSAPRGIASNTWWVSTRRPSRPQSRNLVRRPPLPGSREPSPRPRRRAWSLMPHQLAGGKDPRRCRRKFNFFNLFNFFLVF